ncbi:hypothetical protein BT69DRAFT_149270 [Atractiella rhizophila]|nr:hypothetical protein BT69DRAFT_149270 [Atractiella rhizophila]
MNLTDEVYIWKTGMGKLYSLQDFRERHKHSSEDILIGRQLTNSLLFEFIVTFPRSLSCGKVVLAQFNATSPSLGRLVSTRIRPVWYGILSVHTRWLTLAARSILHLSKL